MKYLSICFVSFCLAFAVVARAQEANLAGRNYDESKEAEIAQKAKKRQYPGGKDESDLKVQSQMSNPPRKMAPTVDVNSKSNEPSAED
jgi:hypothetical protein